MNARKLFLGTVATAGLAGLAWYFFGLSGERKPAAQEAVQVVVLTTAKRQDVPVIIEVNGSVVSLNSVDVRPQTNNVIAKVHIREGQNVKAGEPLFTLDDRADRANLEKAQAQLARDQALLADLERQLRRSHELQQQNFVSQGAVDTVGAQVQSQKAAILADEAAVRAARVALGYNVIHSPVSGRAGGIAVFPGSLVQPTTTTLVTVTQIHPIGVSFTVPETYLQLLLASNAKAAVPVTAQAPGAKEALVGQLRFVDNAVDTTVGSVRAKGVFDNTRQTLWPGQYVNVRLQLDTLRDAVVVPQAAIITNTAGRQVYVVDRENKVSLRKIQPLYDFEGSAVVSGLEGGERIVVEGKQNLRPGGRVKEAAESGTGTAPRTQNAQEKAVR